MIRRPFPHQRVELHYGPKYRASVRAGLHLACGIIARVSRGPGPHNVGVVLDSGEKIVVPKGNLFIEEKRQQQMSFLKG